MFNYAFTKIVPLMR